MNIREALGCAAAKKKINERRLDYFDEALGMSHREKREFNAGFNGLLNRLAFELGKRYSAYDYVDVAKLEKAITRLDSGLRARLVEVSVATKEGYCHSAAYKWGARAAYAAICEVTKAAFNF